MRYRAIILFLVVFLLACDRARERAFQEMEHLEYLRHTDPDKFFKWLNSDDHLIRENAIKTLGRIQDTTTISWAVTHLTDENAAVRSETAFTLGQYFSRRAERPILDVISTEEADSIRAKLLEALGKVGTSKSFNTIRNFMKTDKREFERAAAVSCGILAYRGFPPINNAPMLGIIFRSSQDPEVRWRAVYGLYRMGSPIGFNTFVNALDSRDRFTDYYILKLHEVITGMLKSPEFDSYRNIKTFKEVSESINSERYINTISALTQDSLWYNRLAALQVIANMTSAALLDEVMQSARDQHPYVRQAALQALSHYQSAAAQSFLKQNFEQSSDWRDRGKILTYLIKSDPSWVLNIVQEQMTQTNWPENYYLIQSLKQIDSDFSMPLLRQLAETENNAQLTLVIESLVNKPGVSSSLLLDKLGMNDPAVTTIVAQKIALTKEEQAVDPLIESYQHFQAPADLEVMLAIITALDSIGSRKATGFLEKQLQSVYLPLQEAAATALKRITGTSYQYVNFNPTPVVKFDFPKWNKSVKPRVRFTTDKGYFDVELYPDEAPVTVANFLDLVKSGFYDGIYFHRVVPGFVIQAGDPRGDGWGGPGYSIPCEYNDIFYDRGILGMAHAGKDTGGSQFFITHTPQPHLNGRHTAFGRVIQGMAVVDHIEIYDRLVNTRILE